MRYAKIDPFEVCNGKSCGTSLYVQGCNNHCNGCFNQETWDFNGGKEWTKEAEDYFFSLVSKDTIKRISFLGGEPLAYENVFEVERIINKIRMNFPDKKIWMYTGYTLEEIFDKDDLEHIVECQLRQAIVLDSDYIVDGRFIEEQKDARLAFRGSKNQRVIDVKQTMANNSIVTLY